jgi:CPA2 family monovalent cation:H+ antiporter-2
VKGIAIPGAAIQITLASALGTSIGLLFDLPFREALVLGLAISIASTVVLIRSLEERGLMDTVHGRVAVGWLVAQDAATIVFLALLPSLDPDSGGNGWLDVALAMGKAAVFVGITVVAGGRVFPWLLTAVARTGSRERFILTAVAGALAIATGGTAFGLSVALGAFVAGVAISESDTSHQVAADVVPLRDAFAVLFFVSVGMLLDPEVIRDNAGLFAAVVVAVLFGNAAIAFFTAASFHYPARTALVVGAGLAQLGEFSFIVADEGREHNLVRPGTYNVVLGASAVAITVNPLAFGSIPMLDRALRGMPLVWRIVDRRRDVPGAPMVPEGPHVVVIGYGRVGS